MSSDEDRTEGKDEESSKEEAEEYLDRHIVIFPEVDNENLDLQQHELQSSIDGRETIVESITMLL
jgi:hypothetical protein